jgi:hypothetical protein
MSFGGLFARCAPTVSISLGEDVEARFALAGGKGPDGPSRLLNLGPRRVPRSLLIRVLRQSCVKGDNCVARIASLIWK